MWMYSYEAIKICFSHFKNMLANQGRLRLCSTCRGKFRFLVHRNFTNLFYPEYHRNQSVQYYFLQSKRKNHFQTKIQKFIRKPVNAKRENELSHTSLIDSLQNCQSVDEQIKLFHSMVTLSVDDVKLRRSICQDLEKALQSYFPSTLAVHLIGSSANGFGFKGCDVDLSLQFLTGSAKEDFCEETSFSADEIEEVKVRKIYKAKDMLLTVRKILQEAKFKEPLTIIPGRCPILNFSHQNLACDLSVNNSLALHSTNLMLLCGKLDERITPFIQVIIYWAKQCKLVGGAGRFKTYAIFLMAVYFLQTRNPPVLPSLETVFHKTAFLENLDDWSYDVTKYLSHFERSRNNQTVEELLREFFIFYGNYDFSFIICPIHGCALEKKQFFEKFQCDQSFELNTLSIQDPLSPSWNTTTGVNWKHCKKFMKCIITVWETCLDPSLWTPQSQKWGLPALMNFSYDPKSLLNTKEFVIHIPLRQTFQETADNIRRILNYCLHFECYTLKDPDLPKSVRNEIETQTQVKDDASLLSRHVYKANDTWLGRNTFTQVDSVESDFDREHEVSKLMKLQRQCKENETFYFLCECHSEDPSSMHIKFKHLNTDRFIPKLVIFLKDYIPRLIDVACK